MPAKTTKKIVCTTAPNRPLVELLMEQIDFEKLIAKNQVAMQKAADQAMKEAIENLDFTSLIYDAREQAFERLEEHFTAVITQALMTAFQPRG